MKIDLLYALTNRTGEMSWNDVLQTARHHAQLADELGFDRIWLGEHHFDVDGTDASPNPIQLATDLAARTKSIRFGMAAVSITLWHPIRVAEDLAVLDHCADGRLDVAFGRGILPIEVMNLNPEADRWGGADNSIEIFDEKYEIVQKLWTEEVFSTKESAIRFPRRGRSISTRPVRRTPKAGSTTTATWLRSHSTRSATSNRTRRSSPSRRLSVGSAMQPARASAPSRGIRQARFWPV